MILTAACLSRLALVAPASAPTTLGAPATGTGVYDFELRRVADGIYVAVRPDVFRQPVEGNLTFIVNADDVVVVPASSPLAAAPRAHRAARSRRPSCDRSATYAAYRGCDRDHASTRFAGLA